MWRLVIFATFALLASADIDNSDCKDVGASYGETAECEPGYVPTGLCSSGREAECFGYHTYMRCCAEIGSGNRTHTERLACDTEEGSDGEYLQCPTSMLMHTVCTSGFRADCGQDVYTRINCCDDHQQTIGTACNWIHARAGQVASCAQNQVITGACSSAALASCDLGGSAHTGVRCCPV